MRQAPAAAHDTLHTWFLAQGEQSTAEVAGLLVDFIGAARQSLDGALYDFRLSPAVGAPIRAALQAARARGVQIRLAYDADKPEAPQLATGMDPAPGGTGAFVQSLGVPWRRIGGMKLMHHKYLVRDANTAAASVWTGSTNFTDDAWTLQENTIVRLDDPKLAAAYDRDFAQLWRRGTIEATGNFDDDGASLRYVDGAAPVHPFFAPGRGPAIDYEIALRVVQARRRVRICSMLLNSGALLSALGDLLRTGRAAVDGIYDQTQMTSVLQQWQDVPHNHWKIGAVQDIVRAAKLVGKISTPYHPGTPHDFMHNKTLIVDDLVITGSYNFSHSAEANAENILLITNPALAEAFSANIDHLQAKYR